jgi:hypothetical protein
MPKNKNTIIGWTLRHPPKPQPVAAAAPKPPPVDAAYERQKAEWLEETKRINAEFQRPTWGEDQKKAGLLDGIDEKLSPEDRARVILSRLENMRDS